MELNSIESFLRQNQTMRDCKDRICAFAHVCRLGYRKLRQTYSKQRWNLSTMFKIIYVCFIPLIPILPAMGFFVKMLPTLEKRQPKKKIEPIDLNQCERQAGQDWQPIVQFITSLLEKYALPALYVTSLCSGLVTCISLVINLIQLGKQRKVSVIVATVTAFINFISTALMGVLEVVGAEIDWNGIFMLAQEDLTEEISEETSEEPKTPSKQRDFIKYCKAFKDQRAKKFYKSATDYYIDTYTPMDFALPLPSFMPAGLVNRWTIAPYIQDFKKYPRWFLAKYWDISEEELNIIMANGEVMTMMADKQASISDIGAKFKRIFDILFSKIISLLMTVGSRLCDGQKITMRDVSDALKNAKQVESLGNDCEEIFRVITGKPSIKDEQTETTNRLMKDIQEYVELPTFEFAKNHRKLCRFRDALNEAEKHIHAMTPEQRRDFPLLAGTYVAGCKRRMELCVNGLPSLFRHEPFLVLLKGEPFVGKTELALHLGAWVSQEILRGKVGDEFVQITPCDKYWPPLGGQRVALFDDAATVRDLSKDLLFGNLKSICSPAYFNAAAADVSHKINPISFEVVIATINTSFDELAARVCELTDAATWTAMCRRSIICEATWVDPENSRLTSKMECITANVHKGDFTHMNLEQYTMQKGKLTKSGKISVETLKDNIRQTYIHECTEYRRRAIQNGLVRETKCSKVHFSAVIHGKSGHGKSDTMKQALPAISKSLAMPVVNIDSFEQLNKLPVQQKRCILYMDDTLKDGTKLEHQEIFMDAYNNKLADGSFILTLTNASPKKQLLPSIRGSRVIFGRENPFKLAGLPRRIGYVGRIGDNDTTTLNREIYTQDFRFFPIVGNMTYQIHHLICSAIGLLILSFLNYYVALLFGAALMFMVRMRIIVYGNQLLPNQVSEYLFDSYAKFLKGMKEVEIRYVDTLDRPEDTNFEIEAQDPSSVKLTTNTWEMEKHVFCNRANYDACTLPWKMFLSEEVFTKLSDNPQKFMIQMDGLTYEKILGVVKKYAVGFREEGIEPRFYINAGHFGVYSMCDNVLSVAMQTVKEDIQLLPIEIPTISYRRKDRTLLNIPVEEIFRGQNDILDRYSLSFKEAKTIREFLSRPEVSGDYRVHALAQQLVFDHVKNQGIIKLKQFKDRFIAFSKSPLGKITLVMVTLWASIGIIYGIVKACKNLHASMAPADVEEERRPTAKGRAKRTGYTSELSDDERQKRPSAKGRKKRTGYTSELSNDEEQQKRPRGSRKAQPTGWNSEPDVPKKQIKETVNTLVDMNNFNAYKSHVGHVHESAQKSMVMFYVCMSDAEVIEAEPVGMQSCYGLYMGEGMIVTVGHLVDELRPGMNAYVSCDEMKGKFYKASLVKKYVNRDLSIFYVHPKYYNPRSLAKFLVKRKFYEDTVDINACMQRFAPGKKQEWHGGEMNYIIGPTPIGADSLTHYGQLIYGTYSIKLTTAGDCGLPYYACEPNVCENKLIGIHCMGNMEGATSLGICSILFEEDYEEWRKYLNHFLRRETQCCPLGSGEMAYLPDTKPKFPGHKTLWNSVHDSSMGAFADELTHIISQERHLCGMIMKNSGKLHGSEMHSHTQFVPDQFHPFGSNHNWKEMKTEDIPILNGIESTPIFVKTYTVEVKDLVLHLRHQHQTIGDDFRCNINIKTHPKTQILTAQICLMTLKPQEVVPETTDMTLVEGLPYGNELVCPKVVAEVILESSILRRDRGVTEDMPFHDIPENETVKVIGTFNSSKSHTPVNKFKMTPYFADVSKILGEYKEPFCSDVSRMPDPSILLCDSNGNPSQLATQSLQWAHEIFVLPDRFRKPIREEFNKKILMYYANMRVMQDSEVLGGSNHAKDAKYFKGMELDTSIGFTMKQLFNVTLKKDVINCDEEGKYTWNRNEAAEWLKNVYEKSCVAYNRGDQCFIAFTELLKMEKLKPSKKYTGRTFLAQDTLGVLLERKFLGDFAVRAMRDDPACGVGVDAHIDFNKIYNGLAKFEDHWAGDYKRFDRTIPAFVFEDLRDLLCRNNKNNSKCIRAAMNSIIFRIQVVGRTICQVYGGMASGCTLTAPLNSLANDYILFSCFCMLCHMHGLEWSWEIYEQNVSRIFYGDDVKLSVSKRFKDVFGRSQVAEVLLKYFGMHMDSSTKDGEVADYDTWENSTWISRYFRKLDRFPFMVGALKQISINSSFCFVTSLDPVHLASLCEHAMVEAALWDEEYFEKILSCVRIAMKKVPAIRKHICLRDRLAIQADIMKTAIPRMITRQEQGVTNNFERLAQRKNSKLFFDLDIFTEEYKDRIIKPIRQKLPYFSYEKEMASYVGKLNELFQKGEITRAIYSYVWNSQDWACDALCHDLRNQEVCPLPTFTGRATGTTKKEAAEGAAFYILQAFNGIDKEATEKQLAAKLDAMVRETNARGYCCHLRCFREPNTQVDGLACRKCGYFGYCKCACMTVLNKRIEILGEAQREMNVAPNLIEKVPTAPMQGMDVNVVSDSGLFTNTNIPGPIKIWNNTAIALDNPGATGAPFSIETYVRDVYQRWPEKNGSINASQAAGTEVLRISLNPKKWPTQLQRYVSLHNSILPVLDVCVAIAGASGSIGWLVWGWIKNDTDENVTLETLQRISSETVNMNGTVLMRAILTDIRKANQYRSLIDGEDTEPYPAIVLMIDEPVTNINRNDAVNYPYRTFARMGPGCVCMEPFAGGNSPAPDTFFDLGSYLVEENVDLLVGSSAVGNELIDSKEYPEAGWRTKAIKDFTPNAILTTNVICATNFSSKRALTCCTDAQDSKPFLELVAAIEANYTDDSPLAITICETVTYDKICFGFGKIVWDIPWEVVDEVDFKLPNGSTYTCDFKWVHPSGINYTCKTCIIQPEGFIMVMEAEFYDYVSSMAHIFRIYTNVANRLDFNNPDKYDGGENKADRTFYALMDSGRIGAASPKDVSSQKSGQSISTLGLKSIKNGVTMTGSWFKVSTLTGMSAGTTALPTGLKQLIVSRVGTTTTIETDTGSYYLEAAQMSSAYTGLNNLVERLKTTWISGILTIGKETVGYVAYSNGVLLCRTDDFKKIRTSIGTKITIENIAAIKDPKTIAQFNSKGFNSWIATKFGERRKKFVFDLNKCEKQAALAGAAVEAGGSFMSTMGSGLFNYFMTQKQQDFQKQMQQQLLKGQAAIAGANQAAITERQKKLFDQQLLLKGINGASFASGNGGNRWQPQGFENKNLYSSFRKGGTLKDGKIEPDSGDGAVNQVKASQKEDLDSDEENGVVTTPIFGTTQAEIHSVDPVVARKGNLAASLKEKAKQNASPMAEGHLDIMRQMLSDGSLYAENPLEVKARKSGFPSTNPMQNKFGPAVNQVAVGLKGLNDTIENYQNGANLEWDNEAHEQPELRQYNNNESDA